MKQAAALMVFIPIMLLLSMGAVAIVRNFWQDNERFVACLLAACFASIIFGLSYVFFHP